jgi:hypothetical protein
LGVGCTAHFCLKQKSAKIKLIFFTLEQKYGFFPLISHASKTLQKAKIMQAKQKELSEKLQF